MHSLAGQPLHKREEEWSGVVPIYTRVVPVLHGVCRTTRTCEDLAPGWSERIRMVGTVPTKLIIKQEDLAPA